MRRLMYRFIIDQKGATAIEYALIVSLLGLVIAAAVTAAGTKIYNLLQNTVTALH